MIRLTDEQAIAAASAQRLINVVSVPGSGKTTIAAERFGYLRYRRGDARGVLGLSFTRAAAGVLSRRIEHRWGSPCLTFPHKVMTFDQLHVQLLHLLLNRQIIKWPNGWTQIEVVDDYRGFKGFRWLAAGGYQRIATLTGDGTVGSRGRRMHGPGSGIGNLAQHGAILGAGTCSHEDARSILLAAFTAQPAVEAARKWLAATFREIVIDEVYDAAELDLMIARLGVVAGLGISLVGDPRQALYGWRGATPDKVSSLLNEGFSPYPQSRSFRFTGDQMPQLSDQLRTGVPVVLPPIDSRDVDVALARQWRDLWFAGPNVLPLAFRSIGNATDAVLNLLLDTVTWSRLERHSFGRAAALVQLGLDATEVAETQRSVMTPLLDRLVAGEDPAGIMDSLRSAAKDLGSQRRPNRLKDSQESARIDELTALRIRLLEKSLIPGLTVHQAKGGEWPRVGVYLTEAEAALLSSGLEELRDDDCVLYVAITRAMTRCGRLSAQATLFDSPVSE
ncbi:MULTISPECIES: UvrD-helicase domain-containing protein [unclassified Mycobacterium]|uniref:UvrD-helicase domain-containing protein n=1 Tax=unclassified Mycobacterium TaxID=2642494 RepID=UPI0029C99E74|nr:MULTISPECIES: UvrD-helicase domain-containing protein [unclassified Mycobacterium]